MKKNIELLNEVQQLVIDFANRDGTNLQNEFATVADFKKFIISLTFKTLVDLGVETKQAYDMVFGEKEYDKLAKRVWESAQKNDRKTRDSAPCLATN